MYQISYFPSFSKDLKGFKRQSDLVDAIRNQITEIINNPEIGETLSGSWQGFKKVGFYSKPSMRIIYRVSPCCTPISINGHQTCIYTDESTNKCQGLIDFVFVKTREECNNLYAQNIKYSNQYRR